jgi:hypothetical protein
MQSLRITRPTPAFVVALIALVCALGGSAYAAVSLNGKSIQKRSVPANRVVPDVLGGRQINEAKLGIVPQADKANAAVTAEKALTADKATAADTATNAEQLGGKPASAYQLSGYTARFVLAPNIPVGFGVERTAACQAGEVAISGGGAFYIQGTQTTVGSATLSSLAPVEVAGVTTGWRAEGTNSSGVVRDFRAWVMCAQA